MLTEYLSAALRRGAYDKLDDGSFYGEIPGVQGVYASAPTLEACREELRGALEDWLLFSLSNGFPIPELDGVALHITRVA